MRLYSRPEAASRVAKKFGADQLAWFRVPGAGFSSLRSPPWCYTGQSPFYVSRGAASIEKEAALPKISAWRLGPAAFLNLAMRGPFARALVCHLSKSLTLANGLCFVCVGLPLNFSTFSRIGHIE